MQVQHKLAKFTEKFQKYKQRVNSVQIENCETKSLLDIDISNETLRHKFQLRRSKFESTIRKKKVIEAKEKKMKQKRRKQCNEKLNTPSLKSVSSSPNINSSVHTNDSVTSHQVVKGSVRESGKEHPLPGSSNTVILRKGSLQNRKPISTNVASCKNYYAKRFCSLSIKNSAMSKSASNRLVRLLNANDNIFDQLKNMSSKRTPNYDVCKTSVVNRIDKNQPVKRKRMEENEIEFDSSNQKKRVRLDICIPC